MDQNKSNSHNLFNLLFSIVIPVLILNKLSDKLGSLPALVLALCFPLGYAIYDYLKYKEKSYISLLGFLNVLVTGGLAVLKLDGYWFALKEAAFPLLIGIFVFVSTYSETPFIKNVLLNPILIDADRVLKAIHERSQQLSFEKLVKKSNVILAGSFFMSAILNFVLAVKIFTPIDINLPQDQHGQLLNAQIAEMTYKGLIVIAIPSFAILMGLFYYFMNTLKTLTQLSLDEILKENSSK